MTTKHKHYDLIVAWAGGANIQILVDDSKEEWQDLTTTPIWSQHSKYRIAPKPKVKKWKWVVSTADGLLEITQQHYASPGEYRSCVGSDNPWKAIQKIDSTMIEVAE